jgi:transcriptional regulator with XRE-family HTH domain
MMQGSSSASLPMKLRLLRARKGITLAEAAELSGVRYETISELERGARHPQDRTLAKLAKGYGVDVEGLLEEEPVPLAEASDEAKQARGRAQRFFEDYAATPESLRDPQKKARANKAHELVEDLEKLLKNLRKEYGISPPEPYAVITERLDRPTEIRFLRPPSPEERARVMAEHPDADVVEAEEEARVGVFV